MKIKFNKKGAVVIGTVFLISVILNMIIGKNYSFFVIPFTIGVFIPYVLFVIGYAIYRFLRFKEFCIYTNWKVAILLIILELLAIRGFSETQNVEVGINKEFVREPIKLSEKMSFKQFIKGKEVDMNIDIPNQYETLQPNNFYSNHYFNVTTDFPDSWQHDRGSSEYTLFRAFNTDSAMSLALIAIPLNSETPIHNNFQLSPLETANSITGGNYKSFLLNQIKTSTIEDVFNFEIEERKIRNVNYITYSYKSNEVLDGINIPFITVGYQTILWDVIYTFSYNTPVDFYNETMFESVFNKTNYVSPDLSN